MNNKNTKSKETTTTKSRTVKKEVKTRSSNGAHLKTNLIAAIIILFGVPLIFYLLFGIEFGLFTFAGLAIILLFAKLFDATKRKKKQRRIVKAFLIIFLIFGIIGVCGVGAFIGYVIYKAPEFKVEQLNTAQASILYNSDGTEFAKLGSQIRENIEYDELPEIFVDALIATEDSRFFQHNGVDLARFSKAAIQQLLGNDDAGGGSTLSMQVIKNSFTSTTSHGIEGLIRKFTDIYLAVFKLERNYTKKQIIEFYVNNHGLGGAWGVEEASKYYFNKSAKDMNLSEAALIAGLYQAPGSYNPYKHPEAATERRKTVLNLMVRHGYITKEEAELADSIPVESLLSATNNNQNIYQSYIDIVCKEIEEKYGLDPQSTSMLVYTNMNQKKQNALNDIATGKTYKWADDYVQAAIVVVDSTTGKLEALLGNRTSNAAKVWNYATSNFSTKASDKRQIGSLAKPLFDYAPGIEYNNWSTYTLFDDSPYTYSSGQSIKNFDGNYEGLITLRRALSNSRNIPALKAFQQVDKKKVIELVTSVGITPEIQNNTLHEAHAIGSFNGSNAMEIAGAFQIFSNGGKYTEPYAVSKIVLRATGEEINAEPESKQIISDSTAYMIADVLKGVVNNRMKNYRYHITDNFSAKTGTTNYPSEVFAKYPGLASDAVSDSWIVGFTNKTVVSIWTGYDSLDSKHLNRVLHWNPATAQREALLNLVANSAFAHDGSDFVMPKSVVKVGVERGTNPPMLPSASTPSDRIVYELFKKGTEPTETSNTYAKLATPSNFSVQFNTNSVTLSWNRVSDPGFVQDGILGYYLYYNNQLLTFTTNNTYTIDNLTSYLGTYSVKAGYKDTTVSMSNAASQTLKSEASYSLSIRNGNGNTTQLKVGDSVSPSLYDGSMVILKENGNAVPNIIPYLTINISNSSGDQVKTISSDTEDTYTITYTINYNGYSASVYNKITFSN